MHPFLPLGRRGADWVCGGQGALSAAAPCIQKTVFIITLWLPCFTHQPLCVRLTLLQSIDGAGANGSFALAQAAATEPTFTDVSCANNPNCYYSLDWNTQQKYLFIYHLFSLLWVYQFIIGFT